MSEAANQVGMSYSDYLRQERLEQQKHQWIAGEVFAMVGGTPEHARLILAIGAELRNALGDRPCVVYSSELRVRSRATDIATYPDITVVCGPLTVDVEDHDAATNPTLIVEVLSPTTERFDRGDKAEHYFGIPSLREYVLVSQHKPRIEVFRRSDDGSWRFVAAGAGETLSFESIGCTIAVDEVYKTPPTPG